MHYHIGATYERAGRIQEAIDILEYVVSEFPQTTAAGHSQGMLNQIREQRKRSTG